MKERKHEDSARGLLRFLPQPRSWKAALLQLPLILALSAGVLVLCVKIAPNQLSYMIEQFTSQPLLLLMNYVPVFVVMVFLASLTGNVFYGAALTELIWGGLSLANRIKCDIRREPLYPRDLKLAREALSVVGSHIDLPMKIIGALVLSIAGLGALGFLLARRGKRPMGLRGPSRWLHVLISGVLAVVLTFTVFYSGSIYTSFTGGHFFHIMGAYNDLGFIYSFCHHITTGNVDKPGHYDKDEAEAWDQAYLGEPSCKPVNVVVLMGETFTDLPDYGMFPYSADEDVIPFYHEMIAREDVISGHLVVGNLGGGTANTEFDMMTGIQWDSLSPGTTVAFRTVDNNIDSIFRLYHSAGYLTSYIHPGNRWFYNRNHVLPRLGAESTIFMEDMEDPDILGGYVADDACADLQIEKLRTDMAGGQLIFNYTTNIQNHMYYDEDKYEPDVYIPPLQCSVELPADTESQLAIYFKGLRDCDASLRKVVSYLEDCGEPILFVFYGDHLPYLGDDGIGYEQLGLTEDVLPYDFSLFEPPYLIWANEEAKEILDWDNAVASLELSDTLSVCFMGAAVTELTGAADSSPWFTFLNQLRRDYPVVWKGEYMDRDGNITTELSAEDQARIDKWRRWSYYRMENKPIADYETAE